MLTEFIKISKYIGDIFLNIGFGVTTLVGLLITGGEFIVLTLVFATLIFFRGKRQDTFIERAGGSWIFICTIIAFSLFYTILMISRGVLDFSPLVASEKLIGAFLGWIMIAGLCCGAIVVFKDFRRTSSRATRTPISGKKDDT